MKGAFEVHNLQHMQAIVMEQLGISTQAQEAAKSRILAAHDNYTKVLLAASISISIPVAPRERDTWRHASVTLGARDF